MQIEGTSKDRSQHKEDRACGGFWVLRNCKQIGSRWWSAGPQGSLATLRRGLGPAKRAEEATSYWIWTIS